MSAYPTLRSLSKCQRCENKYTANKRRKGSASEKCRNPDQELLEKIDKLHLFLQNGVKWTLADMLYNILLKKWKQPKDKLTREDICNTYRVVGDPGSTPIASSELQRHVRILSSFF